jgi:hypothetical protein
VFVVWLLLWCVGLHSSSVLLHVGRHIVFVVATAVVFVCIKQ